MTLRRRTVLQGFGAAGIAAGLGVHEAAAQQVPWSTGTEPAKLKMPAGACDCHHHIYDARFPIAPSATLKPADAKPADYRLLQKRIGTTRSIVVQPSTYGTDNACTLDGMAQLGAATTRGVAVVDTSVTDAELKRLHGLGMRGTRFNLVQAGATTVEMLEPLSKRVHELGWHIQINAKPELIVEIEALLLRLPSPLVFDHLAHVPRDVGVERVLTRVELAAGKPLREGLARVVEHAVPAAAPDAILRRRAPEALGIAQRAFVRLLVDARHC